MTVAKSSQLTTRCGMTTTELDAWDRTRRRGSSADEQRALKALVRRQRMFRGALEQAGVALKSLPKPPPPAASQRVGKQAGWPTRSHTNQFKPVPKPAGLLTYIDRLSGRKLADLEATGGIDAEEFTRLAEEREQSIARHGVKKRTAVIEQTIEFPYEMTPEDRKAFVEEYVKSQGKPCRWAIHSHSDGGKYQPHVHILWISGERGERLCEGSAAMKKNRVFVADLINETFRRRHGHRLPVEFWGKKDAEMDQPGITDRPPKKRKTRAVYECQKKRDKLVAAGKAVPEAVRRLAEAGDRQDEVLKKAAEQGLNEAPKSGKEARIAEYGAMKEALAPWAPPTEGQKKYVARTLKKLARMGLELPKDWRTMLDGGELIAAVKAAEKGYADGFKEKMAIAVRHAELRRPVLAPVIEAAKAQNIDPREAGRWHHASDEARRAIDGRAAWQAATDAAMAAGHAADLRDQLVREADVAGAEIADGAAWDRAADDAGRDLEDHIRWQQAEAGARAAGAEIIISTRIAQAGEMAGADIIARRAWNIAAAEAAKIEFTSTVTLDKLTAVRSSRNERIRNKTRRTGGNAQEERGTNGIGAAGRSNAVRDLEKHTTAEAPGGAEPNRAETRYDHGIADRYLRRAESTGGDTEAAGAGNSESAGLRLGGRRINLVLRKSPRNIHRVFLDDTCVAILMPQQNQHLLLPMEGNIQNAGPLKHLHSAPIDVSKDINAEIAARFEEFYIANPRLKPPEKPVEATAPKAAPVPAPPPAQEATMAKPAPKPRPPTENELRNADIEKSIGEEPNIRQAWSDIDLRLAQDIDQMKHGELADALINGSRNRYDLAHTAGYLSKENLARINARDKERYEVELPKNPSREVIEKQEQEKQTAADRIRAAFAKLASVPAAKDAFEAGKRLMEALKEMMEVNKPQAQKNTDKRHPDQKHPDEITPEDFKQLVREERERQMKDPAVHFHRDRAEVVVARRLAEKRRALEERNSGGQQPPIIIVVQQQQGEDLDRLIGRLSDPSKLHALTAHLKTIGEEVRYPASRPMDLIPPASMTKMAATIEQMIAQELGRHQPKQATATSPSAPSAAKAQQSTAEGIYWPREDFENAAQRRENIMSRLKDASPRELEELRAASKALSAEKKKLSADMNAKCYENGFKKVEEVMMQRGLLAPDQSAEGRLKTEQERRKQQAAADAKRGGGRGG